MAETDTDSRQPALRVVASPQDTNAAGDIFGGWIMAQVDVAGSVAAYRRAGGRVATVAVDSLQFHQPVLVGDLVSCYAEVVKVGNTSITVHVEVFVERDSRAGITRLKVTEANLVYVALDENGKPRPV
ncbi:acyl-CoA thioesterase [Thiohalobacter thiocyanaticus]|uniref:Acyl-CoA thioesterase n=1 Tax=Thiohalobacter thiocyanaticus TaxID=585455 RepID=A0A426QFP9_9GAMM|nr:acyl-CoA thioesterase [Thiohalobacter thiocyanaticus]RRQ20575.1 acyl-CoA thioesterase [Thiohalobacter thiocyanaticus]